MCSFKIRLTDESVDDTSIQPKFVGWLSRAIKSKIFCRSTVNVASIQTALIWRPTDTYVWGMYHPLPPTPHIYAPEFTSTPIKLNYKYAWPPRTELHLRSLNCSPNALSSELRVKTDSRKRYFETESSAFDINVMLNVIIIFICFDLVCLNSVVQTYPPSDCKSRIHLTIRNGVHQKDMTDSY